MEGVAIPFDENYNHLLCIYLPALEWFLEKENIKNKDYPIYCMDRYKDVFKKYSTNILSIKNKPNNIPTVQYHERCLNDTLIKKVKKTLMLDFVKQKQENCIFIKRKNRKIKNEKEVLNIFENKIKTNIKKIDFEDLSFDEQRKICNSSKIMIGVHGAGLTNLMFMEDSSKIFEIDPFDWEYYCGCKEKHSGYGHLAKCLNMKNYFRIHQPKSLSKEIESFEVNLNDLQEKLNLLE